MKQALYEHMNNKRKMKKKKEDITIVNTCTVCQHTQFHKTSTLLDKKAQINPNAIYNV
jgi:tRNA A37 methylthiotransferase MiaB